MTLLQSVLGGLAGVSLFIVLWQWLSAVNFPLRRNTAAISRFPSISILKPLNGADESTRECLESWLVQDYPADLQFLFGVRSPNDPVCALVHELLAENPEIVGQLVICPQALGPNGKVSTLAQLQPLAKHELILVSDADVAVDPGFLMEAVAHFENPDVGLVCSFYAFAEPRNIPMHLEALAVNVDFWGQVLQGRSMGKLDFALGAVMITRRPTLEQIGGFQPLVNYLADDYQLGNRVAAAGHEVRLANTVATCWSAPMSARAVWNHQVRWARTIRVSRPLPYFFSILGNATLWAFVWAVCWPSLISLGAFQFVAFTRIMMASDLQRRLLGPRLSGSPSLLILIKDLFQAAVWASAFIGNRVQWRGDAFTVLPDGTLRPSK